MTAARAPRAAPRRLRAALGPLLLLLGLATLLRAVFWLVFRDPAAPARAGELLTAARIGLALDLRLALLLCLPAFLLGLVPPLDPTRSERARRAHATHGALVATAVLLVHLCDLGHQAYLDQRLDASALRLLDPPDIALRMVWESYPVVPGLLLLAATFLLARAALARWSARALARPSGLSRRGRIAARALAVLAVLAGLYGKVSWYPLRWSDATIPGAPFLSAAALNPVLYLFDTACTSEEREPDPAALAPHYERVAAYLGVDAPDPATRTLARRVRPTPLLELADARPPNVVIVLLESFATHFTGLLGNPLAPTPAFDALAAEGHLWTRCYSPEAGTARAVFALLTGLPDTATHRTATRNPRMIAQDTVLTELAAHEKHYFLGGSASWANIRGLLVRNVPDLVIHEEGDYPGAERGDAWGISDLHLLEAATATLRAAREPFVAIVHTSGNHRPYTIPADRRGFEPREPPAAALAAAGFRSSAEYNSLRFLDHALGTWLAGARGEPWLERTLVVLVGDNGSPGRAPGQPPLEERLGLNRFHTPLVLWSPALRDGPRVHPEPASQLDVLPTVAGALGIPARNTGLGRNLLDPRFDERVAFVHLRRGPTSDVGAIARERVGVVGADGSAPRLYDWSAALPEAGEPLDLGAREPAVRAELVDLALGLYHASRWRLYHREPPARGADAEAPR